MKEEKKEIIKQDLQGAEQLYILYVDRQQRLQKIIDDVAQMFRKYFVVPDDQLGNFIKNKPDFDQWVSEKVKEEVSHFGYVWQQRQTEMELQPVVENANKLYRQVEGLFTVNNFFRKMLSTGQGVDRLDTNNFIIKGGKVCVKSGLKQELTELFTLYLGNSENRQRAYLLATEIKSKIELLAAMLPKGVSLFSAAPIMNPDGTVGVFAQSGILSTLSGQLTINEDVLVKIQ